MSNQGIAAKYGLHPATVTQIAKRADVQSAIAVVRSQDDVFTEYAHRKEIVQAIAGYDNIDEALDPDRNEDFRLRVETSQKAIERVREVKRKDDDKTVRLPERVVLALNDSFQRWMDQSQQRQSVTVDVVDSPHLITAEEATQKVLPTPPDDTTSGDNGGSTDTS